MVAALTVERGVELLKKLLAEATPGPWAWNGESVVEEIYGRSWKITQTERGELTIFGTSDADVRLIVAAVNALPALLAVYDAAAVHLSLITYDQDPRTWSAAWLGAVEALAAAVAASR